MKKIQMIILSLVAVTALGAMAASAYGASEWLLNGSPITTADSVETSGSLILEDSASGTGPVECSGIFVGTVGPGAADKVTEVLSLTKTAPPLDCHAAACESELAEVTPIHLPWTTKIVLNGELFVDDFEPVAGKVPGYTVTCKIFFTITDTCEGLAGADLKNVASGVEGTFEVDAVNNPKGNCSIGGAGSGQVTGKGVTVPVGGGTLTVS
jgi:hypothetical protein